MLPEIRRLDLLVLGGGGILFDAEAAVYLREVQLAHENDVPVMVYAVGAGPLEDPQPSLRTGYTVPFDPEIFKLVMLDMLDEAGVRFLLHAFASGVIGSPGVEGVIFESKSGPLVIRARCVVDCTGDGDVAAHAGAPFEIGRADGLVQPVTLMFRMAEFAREAFDNYVREHPDQWRSVHGLWDLIDAASRAGELDLPREDILFFATPHPGEVGINSTRITGVRGIDVWNLTRAEWHREGRCAPSGEAPDRGVPAAVR